MDVFLPLPFALYEDCARPQLSFPKYMIYVCFISIAELILLASLSVTEHAYLIGYTSFYPLKASVI